MAVFQSAALHEMNKRSYNRFKTIKPFFKDYPDVLDIEQMCRMLGISTKTGYKLIRDKKIVCLKVGRAYRILKVNVLAYLNSQGIDGKIPPKN